MINQTDIAHSTPPQLWPKRKEIRLTKNRERELQRRIRRLAAQVEKLSWMLEQACHDMAEVGRAEGFYFSTDPYEELEDLQYQWSVRHTEAP